MESTGFTKEYRHLPESGIQHTFAAWQEGCLTGEPCLFGLSAAWTFCVLRCQVRGLWRRCLMEAGVYGGPAKLGTAGAAAWRVHCMCSAASTKCRRRKPLQLACGLCLPSQKRSQNDSSERRDCSGSLLLSRAYRPPAAEAVMTAAAPATAAAAVTSSSARNRRRLAWLPKRPLP